MNRVALACRTGHLRCKLYDCQNRDAAIYPSFWIYFDSGVCGVCAVLVGTFNVCPRKNQAGRPYLARDLWHIWCRCQSVDLLQGIELEYAD